MDLNQVIMSATGGALIGLSATIFYFFNGRIAGISGILSGALLGPIRQNIWRYCFLAGLILPGVLVQQTAPQFFVNKTQVSFMLVALAGILVGFGTVMASGCTSGHGVCGISRLSIRSIVATMIFMLFGFLSVQFFSGIVS